jgi:hypothetical protein
MPLFGRVFADDLASLANCSMEITCHVGMLPNFDYIIWSFSIVYQVYAPFMDVMVKNDN